MILVTTYKLKPFLSREETRELMDVFAEQGAGPGATAHYVAADGGHGLVISETDDVEGAYRNILNYTQWVEYDTKVMLTVEQAVPHITDAIA
ncbi:MAG TPA: DUF3303 family protein [Solirubrobacterales bacterium]|jgi:hypothetical protein|nr:DUF3303 family protein [Solirubrobacterales bacterium]